MHKRYDHMASLPSLLIMHCCIGFIDTPTLVKYHFGDVIVKEYVKSNMGRG